MFDAKTTRKIAKTTEHAEGAAVAAPDVLDFLKDTPLPQWDLEVMRNHARKLEACGCHLRRLLDDLEAQGLID